MRIINPEDGFTSDVLTDANRFVGRTDVIRDCINSVNSTSGMIAIYGKRGVGKSSILRQIQQMALGDYQLASRAVSKQEIPERPRRYLTVFYTCDNLISDGKDLLRRMCNDQDAENGLLRLVPQDGKDIIEFSRSKEVNLGVDLKVVNWGAKGIESSKYARTVEGDVVQTFRNYLNAIVTHQVKNRLGRDGLMILLDEFDVIQNKDGLGSIIKSLSSPEIKFAICGIGSDLNDLVTDHASVERLLEEGAVHMQPMDQTESESIISKAEELFGGKIYFDDIVRRRIGELSQGYPYLVQLFGKQCVQVANKNGCDRITEEMLGALLEDVKQGKAFPTLESQYQRAKGTSADRQMLMHLLAEQKNSKDLQQDDAGTVYLSEVRADAEGFNLAHIDQLMPRLVDSKYGPLLRKESEKPGVYSFVNPMLRIYITLRKF